LQRPFISLHGIEGGLAAPFLLLGCGIAIYASLELSPVRWTVLCLCLAVAWFFVRHRPVRSGSLTAVAVYGFCLWLVANNIAVSPSYTAAAPFHAAILALSFALGRRLGPSIRDTVLLGLCGIMAVLAGVGLWEIGWSGKGIERAHSIFLTPATLATVINLSLLPVIAFAIWGERKVALTVFGALLFGCLLLTVSRGGLLGFCGGILAISVLARMNGFAIGFREIRILAAIIVGGWALAEVVQFQVFGFGPVAAGHEVVGHAGSQGHSWLGDAPQASSVSRLELYALAVSALREAPLIGIGYMGFSALLEAKRDLMPSFVGLETAFVHNDYLQTMVELGALGLMLLASTIALAGMRAARAPQRSRERRLLDIALFSAIASMCTHALVDFPFYVSLCLLLFGLAVGLLDQTAGVSPASPVSASPSYIRRLVSIGIAAASLVLLLPPTIAEAAAARAHQAWRSGSAQAAAYWFEVARRFAPRDWRYHWSAGNFWYLQALETSSPVAASLADAAFVAGVQADPRNVRNVMGQIDTHRGLRHLLESPADQSTLQSWLEKAVSLAPMDPSVQAEVRRNRSGRHQ